MKQQILDYIRANPLKTVAQVNESISKKHPEIEVAAIENQIAELVSAGLVEENFIKGVAYLTDREACFCRGCTRNAYYCERDL